MTDHNPFADIEDYDVITTEYKPKLNFVQFWLMLIGQPEKFFREYFDNERSPYLILVLMVVGIAEAAERFSHHLAKRHAEGRLDDLKIFNAWPAYWGVVLLLGLVAGGVHYALGGWWYNVRVGMAGGRQDKPTSRFLCLYSAFIPAAFLLYGHICDALSHAGPVDALLAPKASPIRIGVLAFATYFSISVSWRGVMTLLKPNRVSAMLLFFILPGCIYTCIFAFWVVARAR